MNTKRAIIQCNCANGVRWAGFADRKTGVFRPVETVQTPWDIEKFMDKYHVDVISTQYIECA